MNIPKRSNWVPLEVTVKLRVIPAQDPAGPQSVGGLSEELAQGLSNYPGDSHVKWTTSALKVVQVRTLETRNVAR